MGHFEKTLREWSRDYTRQTVIVTDGHRKGEVGTFRKITGYTGAGSICAIKFSDGAVLEFPATWFKFVDPQKNLEWCLEGTWVIPSRGEFSGRRNGEIVRIEKIREKDIVALIGFGDKNSWDFKSVILSSNDFTLGSERAQADWDKALAEAGVGAPYLEAGESYILLVKGGNAHFWQEEKWSKHPEMATKIFRKIVETLGESPSVKIDVADDAICISDAKSEIVMWVQDEWEEDPTVVTAIAQAIKLALTEGPEALRKAIGRAEDSDLPAEA